MGRINVLIQDITGRITPAEVPDDVSCGRLAQAIAARLQWPVQVCDKPVPYVLDHRRSGRRLRDTDTLAGVGAQDGDELMLIASITAGASDNPRLRRLQSDYERLQRLVNQSDLVRIVSMSGNPPEAYLIEFYCHGIESLSSDRPVYRDQHQLRIELPAGYPSTRPGLTFLTPIFHPNILTQHYVCIGPWYASKWLDELVIMIAEMIQYKIPPTRDTEVDVLNKGAVSWLNRHRSMLPIDKRDIRSVGDLSSQIKIGGSTPSRDDDILGRIVLG
jgi:ubiquitin-protein ligase